MTKEMTPLKVTCECQKHNQPKQMAVEPPKDCNVIDNETLEDVLDFQFPKGKSKERGQALVLYAYAQMEIRKAHKEGYEKAVRLLHP